MILKVTPGKPLQGVVQLPGDKSLSHRAALFSALAEGKSKIDNFLVSGVTDAMLRALNALGVSYKLEGTSLLIDGVGLHGFSTPDLPLNCGNSATTLRLLAGALAESGTGATLTGSPALRTRPMNRIVDPLRLMKVSITTTSEGTAPLELSARDPASKLEPLDYSLPVASAQVKSCLMLAALNATEASRISEPGPSRDHTERMLASMGVRIQKEPRWIAINPVERLSPLDIRLPGDFSSASFLIVAALIVPDSEIVIKDVGLNPTRTGFLDVLQDMGAKIKVKYHPNQAGEPTGDLLVTSSALKGGVVSGDLVVRMIDEFPIFAVVSSYAQGESKVTDAIELRYKESDRISSICKELSAIGGVVSETSDGFCVHGSSLQGGNVVDPHGDHRLAMAFTIAGLASHKPITIVDAEIMSESFPEFISILQNLGADIQIHSSNSSEK